MINNELRYLTAAQKKKQCRTLLFAKEEELRKEKVERREKSERGRM